MRGYFGIGVWQSSKMMNAGNLFRSAHAFDAQFVFTINADYNVRKAKSDTSLAPKNIPWYDYDTIDDLQLPRNCKLVGVELTEDAVPLPRFHHPLNAAYLLGPERGSLTPEILDRCDHTVMIPMKFCVNVATAGAILMYDRSLVHGGHGKRGLSNLQPAPDAPVHSHGGRFVRGPEKRAAARKASDDV